MRALFMVSMLVGVAHAQPAQRVEEKAEADRLFEEGRTLLAEGKRDEACTQFELSFRKDPRAVGTMLNLGLCREEVGLVASAVRFYGEARDSARDQGLAEHEQAAARKIALLSPRVPRLTIKLPAGLGLKTRVLIDDVVIPLDSLEGIFVDPGPRILVVTSPGRLPFEVKVELADSQKRTIDVPVLEGNKTVVVRTSTRRTVGKVLTFGGGGLVLASIGTGIWARSRYWSQFPDASRDGAPARDMTHACWTENSSDGVVRLCTATGTQRLDSARLLAHVASATGIVGAAAVAAGVVLWMTAPSGEQVPSVSIDAGRDRAGVMFTRTF